MKTQITQTSHSEINNKQIRTPPFQLDLASPRHFSRFSHIGQEVKGSLTTPVR